MAPQYYPGPGYYVGSPVMPMYAEYHPHMVYRTPPPPPNFAPPYHQPMVNSPLTRPKTPVTIEAPPSLSPQTNTRPPFSRSMVQTQAAQAQSHIQAQSTDSSTPEVVPTLLAEARGAPHTPNTPNKALLPTPSVGTPTSVPADTPVASVETITPAKSGALAAGSAQSQATAVITSPPPAEAEAKPVEPTASTTQASNSKEADVKPVETSNEREDGEIDSEEDDPDYVPNDDEDDDEDEDEDDDLEDEAEEDDDESEDGEDQNGAEEVPKQEGRQPEQEELSPNKPRKYTLDFLKRLKDENKTKPTNLDLSCIVTEPRGRGGQGGSVGGATGARDKDRGRDRDGKDRGRDRDRGDKWGNRNQRPIVTPIPIPTTPVVPLTKSENAWGRVPPGSPEEEVVRTVRSMLNKITPDNFETLTKKILDFDLTSVAVLQGLIDLLFDKALMESSFVTVYADLAKEISLRDTTKVDNNPKDKGVFLKQLITKCQMEFEAESKSSSEDLPDEEARKVKLRMLGNIRFIGELFKRGMLAAGTMKICIDSLLRHDVPDEEDLESLCRLISTIGKRIEVDKKELVDATIQKLTELEEDKSNGLEPRIRFMILDLLELRSRKWIPRQKASGPRTKAEIHKELEMEEALNNKAREDRDRDRDRKERRGDRRDDRDRDRGDRRGPGDVRTPANPRQYYQGGSQDPKTTSDWTTAGKGNRPDKRQPGFGGTPLAKQFEGAADGQQRQASNPRKAAQQSLPIKGGKSTEAAAARKSTFTALLDQYEDQDEDEDEAVDDDDSNSPGNSGDQPDDAETIAAEEDDRFVRKCGRVLTEFISSRSENDLEKDLKDLSADVGGKFFRGTLRYAAEEMLVDEIVLGRLVKLACARFRKPSLIDGLLTFFKEYQEFVLDAPSAKKIAVAVLAQAVLSKEMELKDVEDVLQPLKSTDVVKELLGETLRVLLQHLGRDIFQEKLLEYDIVEGLLGSKKAVTTKFMNDFNLK
eukprot:c7471_g1_i1.p1 GENE.c7471_g1_i1~~c7471_g1_i1.p1  ORF type:complete len:1071 (+),score=207.75 c7471_g1_i1:260-3214(+)